MDEKEFIAHIAEDGRTQTVEEHLRATAERAAKFAAAFGAADAAAFAGRAHDIGKYSREFQRRIRGEPIQCNHSTAGALECMKRGAIWAACCVMGHHRGLLNVGNRYDNIWVNSVYGKLREGREGKIPAYRDNWGGELPEPPKWPEWCRTELDVSFYVRMLYSCLVDADFLDTEEFMQGDMGRGGGDELSLE